MLCTTVRQILANTEKKYGPEDAVRYKISKNEIEAKSYTQLKEDSESFSNVLKNLGEQGSHISVIGATSYPWLVTYFGTVNSGSVIVPLDVNLPAEDVCDLIDRSDSTILVYDEVRKDVAAIAKERSRRSMTTMHLPGGSCWRRTGAASTMSRNRTSCVRSCLHPGPRERARALCSLTEMWRRTRPAWI